MSESKLFVGRLSYEDYRDREYTVDKMIEVMCFLKGNNKCCKVPDADEKRTLIFLNKALDNYLKAVKKSAEADK